MMRPTYDHLNTLDNPQLMEIVKNYRLHGYPESMRSRALQILELRGMDQTLLRRLGYLNNRQYEAALKPYLLFRRNSKIGFGIYLFFLFLMGLSFLTEPNLLISILLLSSFLGFVSFLLLSFESQDRFFNNIGKTGGSGSALVFFFMGMPLYFLMYYHFKNIMRQELLDLP
ncbi:hypothetical protein ACT6NV_09970 [Robiginitalea sp. IMCC44478]|uniref:hypothetical protein n=1 Tax=Robiginitalea sp. IMCC44478 TaxID=3459122 RepID=UPI004042E6B5